MFKIISGFFSKRSFLLPVLSGALLALAYSPYNFKFLQYFALIPLLIFVNFNLIGKRIFWGGLFVGLVFFIVTTSWFLFASMTDWAGAENKSFTASILIFNWLFYIVVVSLFFGATAYSFYRLRTQEWLDVLIFPSLWVIAEYLRTWSLTLFNLGSGSLLGPHYTLAHLGYVAADSPFLFLAGIGGIYGLSFFIVFVNCLITFFAVSYKKLFLGKNLIKFVIALSIVALLFTAIYLQNTRTAGDVKNKKSILVSAIQTNFPSLLNYSAEQKKKFLDTRINLLGQVLQEEEWPRIIIFPEHSNFLEELNYFYSQFPHSIVSADEKEFLIVDSGWHLSEKTGLAVSRLIYFDSQTQEIVGVYDKMLLMPVGDYIPYFLTLILNLTGHQDWIVNMELSRGYEKGENLTVAEYKGIKAGGLMCSEVISPYLYRDLTRNGAQVLISVASDAVFKGNKALLGQILTIAKTRAVENNRYFIQAANQGESFVIDNSGKLIAKSDKIGNGVVGAEIEAISGRTIYNRFGDWVLLLAAFIIGRAILLKK